MSDIKIRLVCATRVSLDDFSTQTALGKSLALYGYYPFVEARVFARNAAWPSENLQRGHRRRREVDRLPILVFLHDDVHLCDFHWPLHLLRGRWSNFTSSGIAGNIRRVPRQPSLGIRQRRAEMGFACEPVGLRIAHGTGYPCKDLLFYGPSMQEVDFLDGLMLACKSRALHEKGIRFDERFDFHYYDLDFCRQAEAGGMRRWNLADFCGSRKNSGNLKSDAWKAGYRKYLDKWQD